MIIRTLIVAFITNLFALAGVAQSVIVEATMDSTAMLVGEQVRLRAKVSCDAHSKVKFPDFQNGIITNGVEVLETSAVDTLVLNEGKRWELSRSYLLTAFDSALYKIPRLSILVNGRKVQSRNEIALKVNTIEVDESHPDQIKPAHAPTEAVFEWDAEILFWCLLLWGLVVAFVAIMVRLLRNKPITKRIKIKPPTPPHQEAIEGIEKLRCYQMEGQEAQKEYFMRLTDVLRTYIYKRFDFNAREMTSEEILSKLSSCSDEQALHELQAVLTTADLVKFARYEASMLESDRALLQAVDYVQVTKKEILEADQPKEQVIIVGDIVQQRMRRIWTVVAIVVVVVGMATFMQICYLLWINFL